MNPVRCLADPGLLIPTVRAFSREDRCPRLREIVVPTVDTGHLLNWGGVDELVGVIDSIPAQSNSTWPSHVSAHNGNGRADRSGRPRAFWNPPWGRLFVCLAASKRSIPPCKDKEAAMTGSDGSIEATPDLQARAAADASRNDERVQQVRLHTKQAQRSAARSFEQSADCHDRTAASYENLAAATHQGDEYRDNAARHREFAREDRRLAVLLRRMADG